MPKMTPDQLEQTVRALITEYIDVASRLSSLKIEVDALRSVLAMNAPRSIAGYEEKRDALMREFLDQLDSLVAKGKDAAAQLRLRRILEEFDGPEQ